MRVLAVAGSLLALMGAPGRFQAPQPRLPNAALDAADAGALPLATVLATRGVPASVVTTEDPSAVTPIRIDASAAPALSLLDDVIARFRAKHPDYAIAVKDGVLSMEQPGIACGRALDTLALKANSVQTDAVRLLTLVAWLASGDPPPVPAGIVSVLGGREGDPLPPRPALPPIQLTIPQGMTLRAAFDQVVRLNKGGVWIVWQHTRDDGSIGCRSVGYYSNGQVGASRKDFATVTKSP